MSDRINIVEEYRTLMAAVLAGRMTDDERAMWLNQLAEMRAGYVAGMWGTDEEKGAGVEQAPAKVRLVWGKEAGVYYLSTDGDGLQTAYYGTGAKYAFRYPGGSARHDRRVPVDSLTHGLRTITDMARADGYEVDDHPDAA